MTRSWWPKVLLVLVAFIFVGGWQLQNFGTSDTYMQGVLLALIPAGAIVLILICIRIVERRLE